MVPQTLSAFSLKIKVITPGGDIEYEEGPKNKYGAIFPGVVYKVMGSEWLGKPLIVYE